MQPLNLLVLRGFPDTMTMAPEPETKCVLFDPAGKGQKPEHEISGLFKYMYPSLDTVTLYSRLQ